jgi:phosphatidylglycerophosphate synthase
MILDAYRANATPIRLESADPGRGVAAGTFAELLLGEINASTVQAPQDREARSLPFAVDGRPDDSARAEYELARSIREETKAKDAPLARWIDRRVSWRLSYRLARTRVRPNHVTIANTLLGLLSASLFAVANYWAQLGAALLFVLVIILDGVDGELARLKMRESEFGANLDVMTDAIVNLAVLVGIIVGCYRTSGNRAYVELLPVLAGGFALCAVASYLALQAPGHGSPRLAWLIERLTSRDFAYLLVLFALFDSLRMVAWGTAFGSYVVGLILLWAALRMRRDSHLEWGQRTRH